MKIFVLNRNNIIIITLFWLFFFVMLSNTDTNYFQILNIVGFCTLIILPGALTIPMFRVKNLDAWGYIGLAIGLSLLELMGVVLLGNLFLPFVGVMLPLSKTVLLAELTLLIVALLVTLVILRKEIVIPATRIIFFDKYSEIIMAFLPSIFVLMSILGAIRLNNGGDGIITYIMLIAMAIYSAFLIRHSKTTGPNAIPIALFFMALSLLLMTSLRGWYITGHDVLNEFRVFEIAKNNSIWSIEAYRDAYNACMSITILPTIFSKLLNLFDPYVYKVLFQIIFATVPGILYLTVRKYTTSAIAFLSVLYFISFPTFFSDMPMLNRQEIAFLFLILMTYIIFQDNLRINLRRYLFVILGLGVVLSHYTTTYTIIAILLFLISARPVLGWAGRYLQKRGLFLNSGILSLNSIFSGPIKHITVWMVMVLVLFSFLWSSVFTDTSSNSLSRVVISTINVIKSNIQEDQRSGDILYSLFSWRKFEPSVDFENYQKKVIPEKRAIDPELEYYDMQDYEDYPIKIARENIMPLTTIGKKLESTGIDVVSFNFILRQATAKMLQILVIIGLLFMLLKKRYIRRALDTDFILLAGGSMVLVLSQVLLPILSVEYGILRAFQQALFFLGIFIVLGSFVFVGGLKYTKQIVFVSTLAIIFFLSSTGVITQTLGGYGPQLHLDNDGLYYDNYYLHNSEVMGAQWLANKIKENSLDYSEIQSDFQNSSKVRIFNEVGVWDDIHPALVQKNIYVFLGRTNTKKQQVSIFYNGNIITYIYPVEFLDENKNLVYNNGEVNIYR